MWFWPGRSTRNRLDKYLLSGTHLTAVIVLSSSWLALLCTRWLSSRLIMERESVKAVCKMNAFPEVALTRRYLRRALRPDPVSELPVDNRVIYHPPNTESRPSLWPGARTPAKRIVFQTRFRRCSPIVCDGYVPVSHLEVMSCSPAYSRPAGPLPPPPGELHLPCEKEAGCGGGPKRTFAGFSLPLRDDRGSGTAVTGHVALLGCTKSSKPCGIVLGT